MKWWRLFKINVLKHGEILIIIYYWNKKLRYKNILSVCDHKHMNIEQVLNYNSIYLHMTVLWLIFTCPYFSNSLPRTWNTFIIRKKTMN